MTSPTGIPSAPRAGLPTHRSTEPDPGVRGRVFGAAMAAQVATTVRSYRRLFAAVSGLDGDGVRRRGARVGERLAAAWPELMEEIAGIAEGAGQDAHELLAINARTELLAPAARPECSFAGALPHATATGETLMAQNWDWHPDQAGALVGWTIELPDGGSLRTLTEAGILAKIGLNDRGLGCCLNMLGSSRDGGVGGVPIHVLLRLVLERCATVAEAVELLLAATVTASSSVNLGSVAGGEAALVSVELCPAGSRCVWPGASGTLAHANHFLHPDLAPLDTDVARWPETLERQCVAEAHLAGAAGRLDVERLSELLRSHEHAPDSVCRHDDDASVPYEDRDATLASVVMRLEAGSIAVAPGPPCQHAHAVW